MKLRVALDRAADSHRYPNKNPFMSLNISIIYAFIKLLVHFVNKTYALLM